MQIKKYAKQPTPATTLAQQLAAYSRQAKHYRRSGSSTPSLDWKKGALAALIPLAAVGAAEAQCQGGAVTINITSTSGFVFFDVDGAGGDFLLQHQTNGLKLFAQTGFFAKQTGYYVANVGVNFNVTDNTPNGFGSYLIKPPVFPFPIGATGYVAIRKGNASAQQPGWIKLTINSWSASGASVTIHERGVEVPPPTSDNSATTDNCASLLGSLPVEMTRFDLTVIEGSIRLTWSTASEQNNSGYEVQRSTDGRSFHKIGWVEGMGTTSEAHDYAFLDDKTAPNTTYYYRLRQLDHDGTEELSPVGSAMVKDDSRLTVEQLFPNPVSRNYGFAMFRANVPQEGDVGIQLFDARGGLVKSLSKPLAAGTNTFSVPVGDVEAGSYFVKMQVGKEVKYQRLVVK